MVQTVKEFVTDCYQLTSANSPFVTLPNGDFTKGLQIVNELLGAFSGTGNMLTISQEISTPVNPPMSGGKSFVTFAASGADVNNGRLANIEDAWLVLDGVTYPLIPVTDHSFDEQYKYDTLAGLPIYAIIVDQINQTRLQLYPAPSQQYQLFVYGKFELPLLTPAGTMAGIPTYYLRFLKLAAGRDISFYKGRSNAWDEKLENMYLQAYDDMQAATNMNLNINDPLGNQLNGAYRVRAGI